MAKPILMDGAMGTLLMHSSATHSSKFPELVNLLEPELVSDIHSRYISAGSQLIYANTFNVNPHRAELAGYDLNTMISTALNNARYAADNATHNVRAALDIGPLYSLLEPYGDLSHDEAYDYYSQIIKPAHSADCIVFETISDINELVIAIKAAKDLTQLPIYATMTFGASGKTSMGCSPSDMAQLLRDSGVTAIGLNCSLGPAESLPIFSQLAENTELPLIIKPNAGMPNSNGDYSLNADDFAAAMQPYLSLNTAFIGGCCGTDPSYIATLAALL